jgi:hypothetical protein
MHLTLYFCALISVTTGSRYLNLSRHNLKVSRRHHIWKFETQNFLHKICSLSANRLSHFYQQPALGPTQPPILWVTGAFYLGVKRPELDADHSPPSSAENKNTWGYTSTPQYAFMAWCSVKTQEQLYLYLTTRTEYCNFTLCKVPYEREVARSLKNSKIFRLHCVVLMTLPLCKEARLISSSGGYRPNL